MIVGKRLRDHPRPLLWAGYKRIDTRYDTWPATSRALTALWPGCIGPLFLSETRTNCMPKTRHQSPKSSGERRAVKPAKPYGEFSPSMLGCPYEKGGGLIVSRTPQNCCHGQSTATSIHPQPQAVWCNTRPTRRSDACHWASHPLAEYPLHLGGRIDNRSIATPATADRDELPACRASEVAVNRPSVSGGSAALSRTALS